MQIQAKVIVTNKYTNDKGRSYLTGTDLSTGGTLKVSTFQPVGAIEMGTPLTIDAEFSSRLDEKGGNYLQFERGKMIAAPKE